MATQQPSLLTPATDISNLTVSANTNGLSIGTHRIYIRTKSAEGKWSLTNVKDFIVDNDPSYPAAPVAALNIIAAEYFIDTDPGFGNATAITVTPATDINNIAVAANTNGLSIGTHRIYIRTKSAEGRWSLTNVKDFLVDNDPAYGPSPAAAQNIIAAEYFLDTDPGFGNATPIAVTAATDINNLAIVVNTTGLSNGQHNLFVRTKNQEGRWSLTNVASFFTDLMAVSTDTLAYGNVPVNTTSTKNLIITNNSNASQTINAAIVNTPFTTNASGVITIPAGQTHTLQVSFTPTAVADYNESLQLQTSSGNYNVRLLGSGITQVASWTISPAAGYNYGNIPVNSSFNVGFIIQNTGNVPVTLSNVTSTNAAFVPSFTPGSVIPANGSLTVYVLFTPTAVTAYNAQLKIESSTAGVGFVTTALSGNGYNPGAPPVLQFASVTPYNGTTGVNPAAGQTGNYTYKILYKSSNNRAPQAGSPSVSLDLNGDQDFVDLNEGTFTMTKEGSSTDYVTGVVYTYTYSHLNNTNTAGYKFAAVDDNGNTATGTNTNYVSGPVITDQQIDLRIFANDITFSKSNPVPGETFTVFAKVTNTTALPATNVPVKYYRDTILIGSDVIPSVAPFSNTTISRTLNFAAEGFYPIKVWIDSSNTLGDINVLNNYAIRPIVVGSPNLPGGITVTTNASIQVCPQVKVLITGNAVYYGTGTSTKVAGAEVTINTGTQLITTTTNSNGDFSYLLTGVTCGGNFTYTVSVTDFTFTSSLLTNSIPLPCPAPNACTPAPSQGGIYASASSNPCSHVVGSSSTVDIKLKYRERNLANFWNAFDEIIKDTLKVFQDGVLIATYPSADYSHGPGNEVTVPVNIPLTSTTPVVISAELTYVYVEYTQIPSSLYHGNHIQMSASGSTTIHPVENKPDLTIQSFAQTGFTAFSFNNANIKCVTAGAHTVKVYDSIPGGSFTLIKTSSFGSLGAGSASSISYSDPTMTAGTHFIKVITDADATVTETSETNNEALFTVVVPESDLTITKLVPSTTALSIGSSVRFTATVKNSGRRTGSFDVRFNVNGVQLGALKTIPLLGENSSVTVMSDAYIVNNADSDCGVIVEAVADINNQVTESNETNNNRQIKLGSDLAPYQLPAEVGSASNPAIVKVNISKQFYPAVRNIGERDVTKVTVRFTLNGNWLAADTINNVKAGEIFAAHGSFTHTFTAVGDYVVKVIADTSNTICENNEANNEGNFYIRVIDSKADLEVLSQYINPSSLNPNIGQTVTIVGTVKNTGGKVSTANVMRFLVDDIQLGADVPINAIQPGRDTTVAATVTYSSIISGVKIMKIVVDPANTIDEEREDNNEATRAMIIGDAPDMSRSFAGAISFNPNGFSSGDSVTVNWSIKNNGPQQGTAWARFMILDENGILTAIDSIQFTLASGASTSLSRRMLFTLTEGDVVTQIVNCSPMEFDLLNNNDTLHFSTVAKMKSNLTVSGDLDMKQGVASQLPGWIGGKIMLGDYDLTVNGSILNFDTAHFIITNGMGKLKLVNNKAENLFPVGTSLYNSNFAKINNTGTQDNFSVRVVPYVLLNGITGDTLQTGNVKRTWFIDEQTAGGSNASVELFWFAPDELPVFNRNTSRVSHYTTLWQLGDIAAAATDTLPGRYSRLQTGYSTFSPFSVRRGGTATSLPLKFISCTAVPAGKDAQLTWVTDNESNVSHFEVEVSTNGLSFIKLGEVTATNTGNRQLYKYTHVSPAADLMYYRIRQVDNDGKYTFSSTAKVNFAKLKEVKLYPNPAASFIQLSNVNAAELKEVQILGVDGKLVALLPVNFQLQYNISYLKQGSYFIRLLKKDKTIQTIPFIKQ
ncbi:MAG: choice-of-anchor D domain-containing protein [Chitinophagaceae bacterium]|nr:choice-of-anchor D domain-containing protein [Chitinophagaceae bacterium]